MFVSAIIAAAGLGTRVGTGVPKQLLEIGGAPMLQRTVERFARASCLDELVVALPASLAASPPAFLAGVGKPLRTVAGGLRRQDSVAAAFEAVSPQARVVVVHDAARPFATEALIRRTVEAALASGAAVAAVPAVDTVKEAAPPSDAGGSRWPRVGRTLARDRIFLAQTPQAFTRDVLARALSYAQAHGIDATDEATLVERMGETVQLVAGEPGNLKITTAEDLRTARAAFGDEAGALVRVGTGYDLHRLVTGRPFVLAGVTLPSDLGPLGHSDGDVLCHALADALLGAACLGDIGQAFPDTDPRWRGAPGLELLGRVVARLTDAGYRPVNLDAVVIVERPRLGSHLPDIRRAVADVAGLPVDAVSVKGKTNEGLGAVGRGEAVACQAVATLRGPVGAE